MVAWRVPPAAGKQIAIKGGEKPSAMHVTLAFIPDIEAATTAGLEDCIRIIGTRTPVLQGSIAGIGRFPASESSDGLDVIYAGVDVPGLAALRTEVVECLGSFAEISEAHDFTPHITLAYVEPAAPSPVVRLEPIAIEVDHLVLASKGGTIAAHPLSGGVGEKQDEFAGPFDAEHRRDSAKLEEVVLKGLEAVYKNVRRRLRQEVKATELALHFGFAASSNVLEKHRMLDDLPHDEEHLDELGRPYLPAAFYEGSTYSTLSEKALEDVPFDEAFWAQQKPVFFKEVPTDLLQEILSEAVYFQPQALGLIGNFDLVNEEVLGFVNGYTDAWWGQLTKTTRNTLRKAIEANISNGEPLSALVKAIEPTFGRARARMISSTEVTRMYAEGNRMAYRAAGIEIVEWRTVMDARVDPICEALQGQRWPIGQEERVPPAHVACRCLLSPVSKGVALTERTDQEKLYQDAVGLRGRARRGDKEVTPGLKRLAKKNNGTMTGLDFRLKNMDSLLRKMDGLVKLDGFPVDEAALNIRDALRYTVTLEDGKYGQGAQAMLDGLRGQGYKVNKITNYWSKDGYKGINSVLTSPDGATFELQFHTPQSFQIKEHVTHPLYEQQRLLPEGSPQWKVLDKQIADIWADVKVPTGAGGVK